MAAISGIAAIFARAYKPTKNSRGSCARRPVLDLFLNAIVAGILLGGFYAAVTVGVTVTFGMLDIVNIAHPAFIMLGSFIAYYVNQNYGVDPVVIGVVAAPLFFVLGMAMYRIYYTAFERRGQEAIRGLAFFFGVLFIAEVSLILVFGVDYRSVEAGYIGANIYVGLVGLPMRLCIPFVVAMAMLGLLELFLSRTFYGRAIKAVSQDRLALQLMAANPARIKEIAFGLSIATASVAGALLIIIGPVEPSIGRDYIGRVFAICVLGGMSSVPGTIIAAFIIGVAESFTATFYGPSWSPAIAFGLLLLVLAVRPAGLLGR
ncbi:MAG: branched-chain amino acid ABC transporter permease [Proteobacteria bacterium]|nr:branched-chain amino acid ABC transporter permease [Pseudomonadota bacterium]